MADNTTLNAGAGGDIIATDDIAGVKHQRVKLSVGADGSASDAVPVSAGMDVTGAAVPAVGLVAQFDDTATAAVTENQFAPVRLSTRRALLVEGVASGTVIPVSDGGSTVSVDDGGTILSIDDGGATVSIDDGGSSITVDDGGTTISIDDNSGSITVDGTVAISDALPPGTNAIGKLAANSGVDIGDVDITSIVPGTGTTNLGIAEDAAVGDAKVGVLAMAKRTDTPVASSGTDGDAEPLQVSQGLLWSRVRDVQTSSGDSVLDNTADAVKVLIVDSTGVAVSAGSEYTEGNTDASISGVAMLWEDTSDTLRAVSAAKPLPIAIISGGGSGGTALADDAAFTVASSNYTPVGGTFQTDSVDAGDGGAFRMSANRNLFINIRDNAGNERGLNVDANGEVGIGAIRTSVVPGVSATHLGKAEDAVHTTGDTGVYVLAVRDDAPAAHSDNDGDYESIHVSAEGGVWTTPTPSAKGGCTIHRSIDLDESEEEVKATAGTIYGMWVTNTATATRWIKFYNDTAANVIVGTTAPVLTIGIPGNSSDDVSGNFTNGGMGIAFATAICAAATTGVADNDTGAPGANEVIVNIFFK